jgi:hypothetical protein
VSTWIDVLRAASARLGQGVVAARINYSGAVVSQVLSGTYKGNLQRVQKAVEGAFMSAEVECPVLGALPQQTCMEIQRRPFSCANPSDVQLYRACRNGCPHSMLKTEGSA